MAQEDLQFIMVEGPDGSGKTTLLEKLSKRFKGVLVKITDRPLDDSPDERDKIKTYYRWVEGLIGRKFLILDRFFWSEMVYSVKRGYDAINDEELLALENRLALKENVVIYCRPSLKVLKERVAHRGDDFISIDDLEVLQDRYDAVAKRSPLNVITVDTTRPVDDLVTEIAIKINGTT